MSTDKNFLLGLRFDLYASLSGILGFTMLIREENSPHRNLPVEITDWIMRHSSTFEDWSIKLGNIRPSDSKSLTADQLCQRMIDVFEGIELAMSEGNKLAKNSSLEDKEKVLFDGLISALRKIYEH